GPPRQILGAPQHDYTRALIGAAPALAKRRAPLTRIDPAQPPILSLQNVGKTFALPKVKGEDSTFLALEGLNLQVYPGQTLA
ncbi:hypothetical protein SB717_38305, partial [Priestia sp. SIMBA_032]